MKVDSFFSRVEHVDHVEMVFPSHDRLRLDIKLYAGIGTDFHIPPIDGFITLNTMLKDKLIYLRLDPLSVPFSGETTFAVKS